jgi:alpha-aminoadipate carrier protein LysW
MPKTYCPDCGEAISVSDPQEGATVTCQDCGTKLEIISADPFEVDFPLDYDGWDDDDWDDDDEEWED